MSYKPTQTPQWKKLEASSKEPLNTNELFAKNAKRFEEFSLSLEGLFFDYSKQRITKDILDTLVSLVANSDIEDKRASMFSGEKINHTEGRAVLHTALRSAPDEVVKVDGDNVIPEIQSTLKRIKNISTQIRNGDYKGATGKPIKQIVSIGIGGSDLGPRMVYDSLNTGDNPVKIHFVSNIDADDLLTSLRQCNPETTIFIVISKSFSTQETLTNALTARQWLADALGDNPDTGRHFLAVSSNMKAANDFGIKEENIYPMWEWVNGRYSLWSAVGMPLAIGLGFKVFEELLAGARAMDTHFKTAALDQNIPVLAALIGIWNRNFLNFGTQAVLPYSQKLARLLAYLQQLDMESNGKSVDNKGHVITDYKTGAVLFGEPGTNGQHSFYQLLHQGIDTIPCDFIGVIEPEHTYAHHHQLLLGHMLAQGQAMMQGKHSPDNLHKNFEGNIPTTTILLDKLTPYNLGMLIAFYEHKVFVQGVIWNINSFDQFGVELGKIMARNIENNDLSSLDPSTKGLYSRIHKSEK